MEKIISKKSGVIGALILAASCTISEANTITIDSSLKQGKPTITLDSVREHCDLPENIHPYSLGILESYLDGEKLNSAFARGFTLPSSDLLPYVGCIVRLFGKKNDTYFETYFDPNKWYLNFKLQETDNPNLLPQDTQ